MYYIPETAASLDGTGNVVDSRSADDKPLASATGE